MADQDKKQLKLVEIFSGADKPNQQMGYEKVDDDRVLERYAYPLRWRNYDKQQMETELVITLFDFKSFTATITRETIDRSGGASDGPTHTTIPFSAFENKQAISEAHRALVELGGTPASIEAFMEQDVTTKSAITPLKTIQLNKK